MDIIYFAHSRWNSIRKRPQQLILEVSRYHRVLYIEPPDNIFDFTIERRVPYRKLGLVEEIRNHKIFVLHTYPTLPFKNNSRGVNFLCLRLIEVQIKRAIKYLQIVNPLFWFTLPSQYPHVGRYGPGNICYESMDEWWALSNIFRKSMMEEMEGKLLTCADVVIASSKSLVEKCKKKNGNTYYIPNGADVGHFGKALDSSLRASSLLDHITRPIIGFIGAIDVRIDLDLIRNAALARPHWSFVLVGPKLRNIHFSPFPDNVYYLGAIPYKQLPLMIKGMDVCMMPYKTNEAVRNINPVKGYEYMAAGKPVVSTNFPDCDEWGTLIEIVKSPKEFVGAVEKLMAIASKGVIERRIAFANKNSWKERAKQVVNCFQSIKQSTTNSAGKAYQSK